MNTCSLSRCASLFGLLSFAGAGCGGEPVSAPPTDGVGDLPAVTATCASLPTGPLTPLSLGRRFDGSEDFAFDGRGGMVGKRGNDLVRVNASGQVTKVVASLPGQTLGLRYQPDGSLIAAMVSANKLVRVGADGRVSDMVTGLNGPNGLFVEPGATLWFTEGGGNAVVRRLPDGTRRAFAAGTAVAEGANGVTVDLSRQRLYYTEYDRGHIHRVDLTAASPTAVSVWRLPGAGLDGMTLDVCGNLYVVDQKNARLYRVRTRPDGSAAAAPELLASFPINVANPQFGLGDAFSAQTLYVSGNPGTIYAVSVGIAGAATFRPAP